MTMTYNKTINIKVSEDMYHALQKEAKSVGLTVSTYIRSGLTQRSHLPITQIAHAHEMKQPLKTKITH